MIAWLLAGLLLVAAGIVFWQHRRIAELHARHHSTVAELQRVQQACTLLAPAGVVQRVVSEGLETPPERKIFTALFVDLAGSTMLGEQLEPAVLARLLNGYFQRVSDAVSEYRGRVSTYLGDGVLAYFGALEPNPWQCNDAVSAALALRAAMAEYNRELEREGLPALSIGVGINRGPGLAGLIGSRERREYAVVGPTVNLAARVQALTRTHGVDVLLTESVREQLDPRFRLRAMPAVQVKGIAEPVPTFAVEVTSE